MGGLGRNNIPGKEQRVDERAGINQPGFLEEICRDESDDNKRGQHLSNDNRVKNQANVRNAERTAGDKK